MIRHGIRLSAYCLFAACTVTSGFAADGDPDGSRNVAAARELPSGPGLAARFPADSGIDRSPQVIFAEHFETPGFRNRWGEVREEDQAVLSLQDLSHTSPLVGNQSLLVTADLQGNTGGGMTTWFESADRIHVRFYVRFAEDCDYVHHFVTLRANRAIHGGDAWSGFGGAGEKPEGTERFSTALEPWGDWGKLTPPGKWNFYSYWHEMSASPDGKYWGNAFRPADQPPIPRGQWICAEFMLKHNTPGQPDGEQAWWIDGKLIGHWKGINWRKSAGLQANALTLESYVTDRWTKQRINRVWFDNLVIAREYIGPVAPNQDHRSAND